MAPKYASEQPPGFKNHIEKVAVVGAGGRVGKPITEALLRLGKHTVTAITRSSSTNTSSIPTGAIIKPVSYDDPSSLIAALTDQDCLIITMGVTAPPSQQTALIDAAAAAYVPWILPNEYGYDHPHPGLRADIPIGEAHAAFHAQIERLGKSAWIGVTCGFWYEYSLGAGPAFYGFDFKGRKVTLYDDGETKINTSTLPQCGLGVAKLLGLKILPEDEGDEEACLEQFRNNFVRISSFRVSQKDMLESVLRVTGTEVSDWDIGHESSVERYKAGVEELKRGNRMGFGKLMYSRVFYQDGSGDFETSKGLQNEVLGLPKEDMDEFTKIAVESEPLRF